MELKYHIIICNKTSLGAFLHISSILADLIFRGFQEVTADVKISMFYFLYGSLFELKFGKAEVQKFRRIYIY